jgi:hypothetical protein
MENFLYYTPIYKEKGSKSSADNYRPVLPPIDKIFEAIIGDQIRKFFEPNDILRDSQFGFRNFRSCELALNTMINSWKLSLDIKHNVNIIILIC